MVLNTECIQEVRQMCESEWEAEQVARGENWMEIEWKRKETENKFMMIYGKEAIESVSELLVSSPR